MAEYEFSEAENRPLRNLRRTTMHIAILFVAFGALELAGAFLLADVVGRWISLGVAMLFLTLGWLYVRPLDNLRRVIDGKGQDIRQIMIALSDLRVAYLGGEVIVAVLVAIVLVEIMRLVS